MSEEKKKNAPAGEPLPEMQEQEAAAAENAAAEAEAAGQAGQPDDAGPDAAPEQEKPEEQAEAESAESAAALKEQLAAAQKEAAEAKDRLLRTAAEYDNFRKRSAREQDAAFNNGVGFAVNQILTILDTLEMAAKAETADENYKKGVLMTLDKASAALAAMKVEEIPAEGEPFDPHLHNAVGQAPASEEAESGRIVQVYQKGYRIGERVIRPAAVVVAE